MRLLLLLLLLATPALAQPMPAVSELDRAFEALRAAPDEPSAHIVEQRIRQLLSARATPAIALLLSRGQRNLASDLPDEALELTWRSLSEIGNVSSSSVLHILRDTMDKRPADGSPAVMMAMGPGFCSELVLMQWT